MTTSRKSQAKPRWATSRRPERRTYGGEVAKIAKELGVPYMPWQQLAADVALEIDDEGRLYYREVWITVMRQSGKTTFSFPYQLHRCISPVWGGRQRVLYTAQTGFDARKKLLDDELPLLQDSKLAKFLTRVRYAQGNEGLDFYNGSRIDILGSNKRSGHGKVIDQPVFDEVFADIDDRREQAVLPAMITRPQAQILGHSTQGTDESVFLNRKVRLGRLAAEEDKGSGIAYFEWSVPEDEDIDDEEVWWRYMPALGYTIGVEEVRHLRQTMSDGEFRRAICNQPTKASNRAIPQNLWEAVQDPASRPAGNITWGIDAIRGIDGKPDAAAIGNHANSRISLVDHRPGIGWVVERMKYLYGKYKGRVVVDGGGPAVSIADELDRQGVRTIRLTAPQVVAACARLYDHVADGKISVYPSQQLDESVAGVVVKQVGDRFVWSRVSSSTDATPLMAVTLALSRFEPTAPFAIVGA
jgi:hypothetical protein